MKITVDLQDFWVEEDEISLSNEIKRSIAYQVKSEILSSLKDQIKKEITDSVKSEIEKEMTDQIKKTISDAIKNVELKQYASDDEGMTVEDWILNKFLQMTNRYNFTRDFEKVADTAITKLRKNYDLNFASQIVVKMSDQGLLKDGMAELLIEK